MQDTFRAWLRKLGAAIYSGLDAHFLLVFLVFCVSLGLSKAAYQVAWAEALARTRDVESARSTAEAEGACMCMHVHAWRRHKYRMSPLLSWSTICVPRGDHLHAWVKA